MQQDYLLLGGGISWYVVAAELFRFVSQVKERPMIAKICCSVAVQVQGYCYYST
jgi:hypothetical protein